MKVKIKKLHQVAQLPIKGTPGSAAYDLHSIETVYIPPGETVTVRTGLAMEIPDGWKGDVYSRSGLAMDGVVVANSPGKIDSDYRGEIKVILHSTSDILIGLEAGARIAQFEISPAYAIEFTEEDLTDTERGDKGFGSTGVYNV